MPILSILGFALVVALAIWACWLVDKRRTAALKAVAESMGFLFVARDDATVKDIYGLPFLALGDSRQARNVMRGRTEDTEVTICDYRYTTGTGKNRRTHVQTVVLFQSARLDLPRFQVCPEHWFHKVGSLFGGQDIDFTGHPDFSRLYLLRGEDEPRIRAVFTDALLAYCARRPGLTVNGDGDRLVWCRARKQVAPSQVRRFLEEAFGLFKLFSGQ